MKKKYARRCLLFSLFYLSRSLPFWNSLSDSRFSLSLHLCLPLLLPPIKFTDHSTSPTDSLHPRDHKLVSSIHDQAVGAAEVHPDGN